MAFRLGGRGDAALTEVLGQTSRSTGRQGSEEPDPGFSAVSETPLTSDDGGETGALSSDSTATDIPPSIDPIVPPASSLRDGSVDVHALRSTFVRTEISPDSSIAYFDGDYTARIEVSPSFAPSEEKHAAVPRWRYLYNALLMVLDFLMMAAACGFVFLVKPEALDTVDQNGTSVHSLVLVGLMGLFWVAALAICFAYQKHVMGGGYDLYTKIINAIVVDFAFICTLGFLLRLDLPRTLLTVAPLLAGIFTAFERWLMRRLLHHYRRAGRMTYPTVIVGSTEGIEHTMKLLAGSPGLGYAPIAVCPVKLNSLGEPYSDWDNLSPSQYVDAKRQRVLRVLKFNSHLPQTARYLGAQVVLVTDVLQRDSTPFNAFSLAVESSGIEMAVAATVADFGGHMLRLRDAATPMPVLTARLPQYSKLMRAVKRFIDIVLSSAAIIVAAIPMVVVAILIKHEDGGPVFYTQDRIGLRGQPFRMMKFRSMRVDAEKYEAEMARDQSGENAVLFKLKKDPRVTKIGTFIRKYSIDEVPQFFNVFLGSMSLVGPRPALPYQVKNYESMYSTRLLAKPGLTGPWQVSGRADLTPEQSERVDVDYIENWSLTTDIAILLKTIVVVLRGTGSY